MTDDDMTAGEFAALVQAKGTVRIPGYVATNAPDETTEIDLCNTIGHVTIERVCVRCGKEIS